MQSVDTELVALNDDNHDSTKDQRKEAPDEYDQLHNVDDRIRCKDDDEERGHWGSKLEFFLAIVGYTVGVGSFWRFPIICSRNGGGAFLIPFYFLLITSGGPLYYLEVCIGQFSGQSAGTAFGFCPLLKGLGLLQVTLSLTVLWYLIMISVWVYYYLYSSFTSSLPWATCQNAWNTRLCRVYADSAQNITLYNTTSQSNNTFPSDMQYQSAAFEFWENKVIGRSTGLDDMGSLQPHLVICLIIAWTLTVLAVINGAKTLGKVVYVTATTPFLFLLIMFIRGVTLDGALEGIIFYLNPDFSKLLTVQMWVEAGIQVFYSLGPTWGGVITMASYNKFHQKSFWSSTMCVVISGFSSFFNGLVVFTILGFMAKDAGLSVQEVATQSGPGLTFVVFPIALSKMPLPQLWSVLFFLMLTTVVFDSIFGMFETVSSGIIDFFPKQLTSRRIIVNIVIGVVMALTALPLCLNSGIYVFQLADWYFSQFALLYGSLFECIAVCWMYGTDRFCRDIAMMTGRRVSPLLRSMWTVVIPVVVTITFLLILSRYSTPSYGDGYVYSSIAIAVGIVIGLLPNIGMVTVAVKVLWQAEGTLTQRFRIATTPDDTWQPNNKDAKKLYKIKPYVYPQSYVDRLMLDLLGPKADYDILPINPH